MKSARRAILADSSLFIVACIWGSTFIVVKDAIDYIPVYSFLFMRFGLAGLLLVGINLVRRKAIPLRSLVDGFFLGTALFLVFAFQTYGLRTTPASVTAFITGLYVIFVPLLWSLIRRALPSWNVALGILLALAGLALVTLREAISLTSGEFLVLICAIFCAVHIILTDTFSKRNDAAILTMVQVSIVSLESLAFSLYYDPGVIPDAFPSPVILALIVTSIFATVVAFGVQTAVQKFTSPNHTAIIFTMEPVAAAIFSALMGESPLNLRQYLGGGLIIAAMILTKSGGTNLDDPEIHA